MPQPSLGKNALIILAAESVEVTHTTLQEIERLGGHIVHVYPPHILIGEIPGQIEARVRALANVSALHRSRVDLAQVQAAIRPQTRLIWVETPSNPLLKITDMAAISTIAREVGAICVVDNTWP